MRMKKESWFTTIVTENEKDHKKTNSNITPTGSSDQSTCGLEEQIQVQKDTKTASHLPFSSDFISKIKEVTSSNYSELLQLLKQSNAELHSLKLREGDLNSTQIIDIVEAIKANTTLTSLTLYSASLLFIVEVLKGNTTLASLSLCDNHVLGNRDSLLVIFVAEALKTNTTLTSLNLSCNQLHPRDAIVIVEAIKTNSTLLSLDLRHNSLGPQDAAAIAEMLKANTTLTSLKLGINHNIASEDVIVIAKALKNNSALRSLDLHGISFNSLYRGIGTSGAATIAETLKINTALTSLDIGCSRIEPEDAVVIAEALKTNSTLVFLDLYENDIGPQGAATIAEALKFNTALTSLDLSRNRIGSQGAIAIAEALKFYNTALTSLDLSGNRIGSKGATTIAKSLKVNKSIMILTLDANTDIDKTLLKCIAQYCNRNENRELYQRRNWSIISATLASYRANRDSAIKDSFLPLFSTILKFSTIKPIPTDISMDGKKANSDKGTVAINAFLATRYSKDIIYDMSKQTASSVVSGAAVCHSKKAAVT